MRRLAFAAAASWLLLMAVWLDYVRRHWKEWTL